jgi:hypothetical protein
VFKDFNVNLQKKVPQKILQLSLPHPGKTQD